MENPTDTFEVVRIDGPSMEPAIRRGSSVIFLRGVVPEIGDVVLIECPGGGLVVHRLVGRLSLGGRIYFAHAGDASDRWGVTRFEEIRGVARGIGSQKNRFIFLSYISMIDRIIRAVIGR